MNLNKLKIDLRQYPLILDLREKKAYERYFSPSFYVFGFARIASHFFLSYVPAVSLRALSTITIFALVMMPIMNITAYEAHIINVTARIENDIPDIDPEGGQFCDLTGALVTITTTYPGATIIYTINGTDPICPDDTADEFTYTIPFNLLVSATLKARSCHGSQQSAVVAAIFNISPEFCPHYCGDGILNPPFEECDDGNNINGDGCDANCQKECVIEGATSSAAMLAKLHDGTIVTNKVKFSDNLRAYQDITGTKYIYLNWAFSGLPINIPTTLARLTLEHRESDANISVQWWNGSVWLDVCDPPESSVDLISTCDLLPYIDDTTKAQEVKIRLKLTQDGSCHEELDWAFLEIKYRQEVECDVCGNGIVEEPEECDDGNTVSGDGCSATCEPECYLAGASSTAPFLARLDNGTVVTNKVAKSDNTRAYQQVDDTRYIYLDWQFLNLPADILTTLAKLTLEHREDDASLVVEWWDSANSTWVEVCDPPESSSDFTSYCDLLPHLNNTDKLGSVQLRLKLTPGHDDDCYEKYEKLDWAFLEFAYKLEVPCDICGNGLLEENEECDDGNILDNDGCSATCEIEEPDKCFKINEVYYDPLTCDCNLLDEWIELYNSCETEVDLQGWYLEDNAGVSYREVITGNYVIPANGYVLLSAQSDTWDDWPSVPSSAIKIALGGTALFNNLGNGSDHILLYDDKNNLVDATSWGTDVTAFNPAVPDVARGHSISRKPAGHDTDTNTDWIDTYSGSVPPGPNPGTNPHDEFGNFLLPSEIPDFSGCDYGAITDDNSDEEAIVTGPDLTEATTSLEEITPVETDNVSGSGSGSDDSITPPVEDSGSTTEETGTGAEIIESDNSGQISDNQDSEITGNPVETPNNIDDINNINNESEGTDESIADEVQTDEAQTDEVQTDEDRSDNTALTDITADSNAVLPEDNTAPTDTQTTAENSAASGQNSEIIVEDTPAILPEQNAPSSPAVNETTI